MRRGLLSRSALRTLGFALALASVIAPALPLGPLFAQPPMPLAALWAAYGWAAEEEGQAEGDWWLQHLRALRAPIALALLGLIHDQMSGGPYGLMTALYLTTFLVGRVVSMVMSARELPSLWGGFAATTLASVGVAALAAPWALGSNVSVWPYAQAAAITVVLFPLVQRLYMDADAGRPRLKARAT